MCQIFYYLGKPEIDFYKDPMILQLFLIFRCRDEASAISWHRFYKETGRTTYFVGEGGGAALGEENFRQSQPQGFTEHYKVHECTIFCPM